MGKFPDIRVQPAECVYGRCDQVPSVLEAVEFAGIVKTKRDALLKEIGPLFNIQNFNELVRNTWIASKHMMATGLFDVVIPFIDTSKTGPDKYEVIFMVKEPRKYQSSVRCNFEIPSGIPEVQLNVEKDSVFGRGEQVSANYAMTAKGGTSFNVTGLKPFLGWQKYSSAGVSLFRSTRNSEWNKTNVGEDGLLFNFQKKYFDRRLAQSINLIGVWRQFMPTRTTPFLVREHAGHTSKFSTEHITTFDSRNSPTLAKSGVLLRHTLEYAGLLGDSSFLKNSIQAQWATPIIGELFMGASLSASAVRSIGNRSVHLLDRVYLGGPYNLRSFKPNSIGTHADGCSLGGGFSLFGALHLYYPLPQPKDSLFAHAFLTAGSVSAVRSRHFLRDALEMPRISVGLGLVGVIGPIRIEANYAAPLRYTLGDQIAGGIQLGIGTEFQ